MDNFDLNWFLTIPGMFISAGILLLVVAIIVLIVSSTKGKKEKKKEEAPVADANNATLQTPVGTNASINEGVQNMATTPVDVNQPSLQNMPAPTISNPQMVDVNVSATPTMDGSVPIAPMSQMIEPAPVAPVQIVEPAPVVPTPIVEPAPVAPVQIVEPAPVAPTPIVEPAPVVSTPIVEPAPVVPTPIVEPAPVVPTPIVEPAPVVPTPIVEPAPVAPTPIVEPAPVVPTPIVEPAPVAPAVQNAEVVSTNTYVTTTPAVDMGIPTVEPTPIEVETVQPVQMPQPVIYGGANPTVSGLDLGQNTTHQIYGGANPLENTQSMPIMGTAVAPEANNMVQNVAVAPVMEPINDNIQ